MTGPNCPVTLRYPNGTLLKLSLPQGKGPGLGAIFVGDKGKIEINRNRWPAIRRSWCRMRRKPRIARNTTASRNATSRTGSTACGPRQKPVAHAEIGHRTQVICHLVNICRELGRRLKWDPVKEEFLGDEQANALRSRPRRKGYELPDIT